MSNLTPALVFKREFGTGDIKFTSEGFKKQHWLISAVFILLFTYARADDDVILPFPDMGRGGYWGDLFFPKSVGSLIWLLQRENVTQDTLNDAVEFAKQALSILVEENKIKAISVTGELVPNANRINLLIIGTLLNGEEIPVSTEEYMAYALAA